MPAIDLNIDMTRPQGVLHHLRSGSLDGRIEGAASTRLHCSLLWPTVMNAMKGALGISLLSYPFAASVAGWLPVLAIMPIIFVGVRFGSMLLMDLEHALGRKQGTGRDGTAKDASVTTLPALGGEVGGAWMFWALQAIIAFTQIGGCAAYLLFISSNLQQFDMIGDVLTLDAVMILVILATLPLVMIRRLSDLQACSFLGLVALALAILLLSLRFFVGPPLGAEQTDEGSLATGSGDVTGEQAGTSLLLELAARYTLDAEVGALTHGAANAGEHSIDPPLHRENHIAVEAGELLGGDAGSGIDSGARFASTGSSGGGGGGSGDGSGAIGLMRAMVEGTRQGQAGRAGAGAGLAAVRQGQLLGDASGIGMGQGLAAEGREGLSGEHMLGVHSASDSSYLPAFRSGGLFRFLGISVLAAEGIVHILPLVADLRREVSLATQGYHRMMARPGTGMGTGTGTGTPDKLEGAGEGGSDSITTGGTIGGDRKGSKGEHAHANAKGPTEEGTVSDDDDCDSSDGGSSESVGTEGGAGRESGDQSTEGGAGRESGDQSTEAKAQARLRKRKRTQGASASAASESGSGSSTPVAGAPASTSKSSDCGTGTGTGIGASTSSGWDWSECCGAATCGMCGISEASADDMPDASTKLGRRRGTSTMVPWCPSTGDEVHAAALSILSAQEMGGTTAVQARVTRSMACLFDGVLAVQAAVLAGFGLWVWIGTHSGALWSDEPAGQVHSVVTKSLGNTGIDQWVRLLLMGYIFASLPLGLFPVSEAIEAWIVRASGATATETSDGVVASDGKSKASGDSPSTGSCLVSKSLLPGHGHEVAASWPVASAVRLCLVMAVLAVALHSDRLGKLLALVGWVGLGGIGFAAAPIMYLLWYRSRKLSLARQWVALQLQSWWMRTRSTLRSRVKAEIEAQGVITQAQTGRNIGVGAAAPSVEGSTTLQGTQGAATATSVAAGIAARGPVAATESINSESARNLKEAVPAPTPPFASMLWRVGAEELPTGAVHYLSRYSMSSPLFPEGWRGDASLGRPLSAIDRMDASAGLGKAAGSGSSTGSESGSSTKQQPDTRATYEHEQAGGCASRCIALRYVCFGCSRTRCCWCLRAPGPSCDLGCGDCRLLRTAVCLGHAAPAAQADEDSLMHSWWGSSGMGMGRFRRGGAALGVETEDREGGVDGLLDAIAPCVSGPTAEMLMGPRGGCGLGCGECSRSEASGRPSLSSQVLRDAARFDGNELFLLAYATLGVLGSVLGAVYTIAEADGDKGVHDFVEQASEYFSRVARNGRTRQQPIKASLGSDRIDPESDSDQIDPGYLPNCNCNDIVYQQPDMHMRAGQAQLTRALGMAACIGCACSLDLPPREDIELSMQRADDKLKETMKDWECSWTRGVYFAGEIARWKLTGNASVLSYMKSWADRNDWAPCKAEDHGDPTYGDNQACTSTYLQLFLHDPESHEIAHVKPTLDAFELQLSNQSDAFWWWVDSTFMAGQAWALASNITGDNRYVAKLEAMFQATAGSAYHLWNPEYGLFYRDMRFLNKTYPNGKMYAWGRGNGWAIAATARIMTVIGHQGEAAAFWLPYFRTMAASVIALQNATDGMWRASLTDPEVVDNPETTGSALFVYALAYGLRTGVLQGPEYEQAVSLGWQGLSQVAQQPDGHVGYCQYIGYMPAPANSSSTSDFCVGTFLLAASEVAQLVASRS